MTPQEIQALRDEKGRLATMADEILDKAKAEGRRDLHADENKKFDDIHADIEKLSKRVAQEEKQAAVNASLAEPNARRSEPNELPAKRSTGSTFTGTITDAHRDEAFRSWCLAGAVREDGDIPLNDAQRENAQRCGLDLSRRAIKLRLFGNKALKGVPSGAGDGTFTVRPDDLRAWSAETRAALTGAQSTTTTGGYTVADAAMQALEAALLSYGGMRQVARSIRTATGGPLPFPVTNDTAQKGRLLSENTGATETEMTFGQLTLDAYKYSSDYVLASVEFINDSSINVAEFLGSALGLRIARLQNDHFTTGTGASQPNGIITAATSGVTGVADPPTYDNIMDLIHSVDPAYRPNGRFMMHDTTLKSIKKIKVLQYSGDTTGYPLWQPGLVMGQPDRIHGYEYIVNQSMAPPGSTAKKILFGDFSKYLIRDVVDVTLLRLDERFAELHQVAFLAFARSDGDLLDAGTHPIKYMQQT